MIDTSWLAHGYVDTGTPTHWAFAEMAMEGKLARLESKLGVPQRRTAVGPWSDLALHTMGWRSFQDLCSQVCEVTLKRPVEIFREAQDGGQDAVFLIPSQAEGSTPIGTVQCKHCSDPAKKLKLSDLTPEVKHVKELVRQGQADTYVLMTNMSVDASVAAAIRAKLMSLGVRKPHVLGKQYVVRTIKGSPRLRALLPQVYGLGDLSAILDERLTEQSRALLGHWSPKLKAYVPTLPHRQAVRSILDHGVVLLLGNPSAGKSAIGAILSVITSEDANRTVLALTSPREFEQSWNPDDPNRFFWIDDAFGSNQVRQDYVQDWASTFRKVQAAIVKGNKFLFTSRRHIYEAAKRGLGQRNLEVFKNECAVVDVGSLTPQERGQILYNHINFGHQSQQWKTAVKPFLGAVAATRNFLPGIAERLGDPSFTKGLLLRESSLVRFMEEPREHLIDTINALDAASYAALLLVYVHQGAFDPSQPEPTAAAAVSELSGVELAQIMDGLSDLQGSFLRRPALGQNVWGFAHPTIADALTEILREKPHMVPALVRGATISTILNSFVCEGVSHVRDTMVVPANLNSMLVRRLITTPNETEINWALYSFLAYRSNDDVVRCTIEEAPKILERMTWRSESINDSPRVNALARVHRQGLLDDYLRDEVASQLENAAKSYDLAFLEDEDLLALISPQRLVSLGMKLRGTTLPSAEEKIAEMEEDADLEDEAEDVFRGVRDAFTQIEYLSNDSGVTDLIEVARHSMASAIQRHTERKEEYEQEKQEEEVDWEEVLRPASTPEKVEQTTAPGDHLRSIFDDVDQS